MKFSAHAGRHAVGPGTLDQHATRKRVPRLGNPGAPDGASGRVFARHQAEIGHQLPSIVEASKVADFGYHRDRDDESDPTHCLERRGDRGHRPARHQLFDLPRQPVASGFGILDCMDIVLEDDLLCRMIKAHRGEPPSIGQGPRANPVINLVVAQQKALQMLTRLRQPSHRCRPRAHQIAHRFMSSVGIQIGVSSPARCSFASIKASRRSVLIRSPAFIGISDGGTTMQSCPNPVSKR